jgi:hypothetical protein
VCAPMDVMDSALSHLAAIQRHVRQQDGAESSNRLIDGLLDEQLNLTDLAAAAVRFASAG